MKLRGQRWRGASVDLWLGDLLNLNSSAGPQRGTHLALRAECCSEESLSGSVERHVERLCSQRGHSGNTSSPEDREKRSRQPAVQNKCRCFWFPEDHPVNLKEEEQGGGSSGSWIQSRSWREGTAEECVRVCGCQIWQRETASKRVQWLHRWCVSVSKKHFIYSQRASAGSHDVTLLFVKQKEGLSTFFCLFLVVFYLN